MPFPVVFLHCFIRMQLQEFYPGAKCRVMLLMASSKTGQSSYLIYVIGEVLFMTKTFKSSILSMLICTLNADLYCFSKFCTFLCCHPCMNDISGKCWPMLDSVLDFLCKGKELFTALFYFLHHSLLIMLLPILLYFQYDMVHVQVKSNEFHS